MTRVWRLCMPIVLAVIVAACGRPDILSLEKATTLAVRQTPLASVQDASTTPPGPVLWCLIGPDKTGRPMAVWVSRHVEGQVYLDQGTSREDAIKAATRLAEQMGYSVVSPRAVLANPAKPTWWVSVQIEPQYWGEIFVDFATGEAHANPNDPWDKGKAPAER